MSPNFFGDAQALSPERFKGFDSWEPAHFGYPGYLENANEAKKSEYSEYTEVGDDHEDVYPASSHEGTKVRLPAVFDHKVNYEDTEKPVLDARRNQIRLGNANEEQDEPNHGYAINKTVPHGDNYSKIW